MRLLDELLYVVGGYVPMEMYNYFEQYNDCNNWGYFYKTVYWGNINGKEIEIPYMYPVWYENKWKNAFYNRLQYYSDKISISRSFGTTFIFPNQNIINYNIHIKKERTRCYSTIFNHISSKQNIKQIICIESNICILLNNSKFIHYNDIQNDIYTAKWLIVKEINDVKQIVESCGRIILIFNDNKVAFYDHDYWYNCYNHKYLIKKYNYYMVSCDKIVKYCVANLICVYFLLNDGTLSYKYICTNENKHNKNDQGNERKIHKVNELNNIVHIACNNFGVYILMNNGDVFHLDNRMVIYDEENIITNDIPLHKYHKLDVPKTINIVTAQNNIVFLLLTDGSIMCNAYNYTKEYISGGDYINKSFEYIKNIKAAIYIATNGNTTFIILKDGSIMRCGENSTNNELIYTILSNVYPNLSEFTIIPNFNYFKQTPIDNYKKCTIM